MERTRRTAPAAGGDHQRYIAPWTNLVGLSATVQADNSVLHNGFTPDLLQGSCEGFIAIPGASATLRVDTWHDVIPCNS